MPPSTTQNGRQPFILYSPTRRLALVHPPPPHDDAAVSALFSNPKTLEHLPILPPQLSLQGATRRRLARNADDAVLDFHIHLASALDDGGDAPGEGPGELVGVCGFNSVYALNLHAEIGIVVHPDRHGEGIATEAILTLLNFAFRRPAGGDGSAHPAEPSSVAAHAASSSPDPPLAHSSAGVSFPAHAEAALPPLHRVSFETAASNTAFRTWMEKTLGMEVEYRLRDAWRDVSADQGRWVDSVGYAVLEGEWRGSGAGTCLGEEGRGRSGLKERLEGKLKEMRERA